MGSLLLCRADLRSFNMVANHGGQRMSRRNHMKSAFGGKKVILESTASMMKQHLELVVQ